MRRSRRIGFNGLKLGLVEAHRDPLIPETLRQPAKHLRGVALGRRQEVTIRAGGRVELALRDQQQLTLTVGAVVAQQVSGSIDHAAIVLDDPGPVEIEARSAEACSGQRDDDLAALPRSPHGFRSELPEVDRRVHVARRHHDDPLALDERRDVLRVPLDVDDLLEVGPRCVVLVEALERLQQCGLRPVPRLGAKRVQIRQQPQAADDDHCSDHDDESQQTGRPRRRATRARDTHHAAQGSRETVVGRSDLRHPRL